MYAIVEIAGKQFKVSTDQQLHAPRLQAETGSSVDFDKVFLLADGDEVTVGAPTVVGARVVGTVLSHVRGNKVVVFKKKRRKGYRKVQGHRQDYTRIFIKDIVRQG